MDKTRKLLIIGDSAFAEIAFEYFQYDSEYEVVGFSVERQYLKRADLFGRSIVPFEELENSFDPAGHWFYVACVYTQLNRLRTRLYHLAKAKGFHAASYVSPRAFVWRNVKLGEHCFVFEDNTIQPFVEIGNNVVLWSGNHIGHHSVIRDNVFISSHVVLSGFCDVGANGFYGVNATIGNNIKIGEDALIGSGALIARDVKANTLVKGVLGTAATATAKQYFKVPED